MVLRRDADTQDAFPLTEELRIEGDINQLVLAMVVDKRGRVVRAGLGDAAVRELIAECNEYLASERILTENLQRCEDCGYPHDPENFEPEHKLMKAEIEESKKHDKRCNFCYSRSRESGSILLETSSAVAGYY